MLNLYFLFWHHFLEDPSFVMVKSNIVIGSNSNLHHLCEWNFQSVRSNISLIALFTPQEKWLKSQISKSIYSFILHNYLASFDILWPILLEFTSSNLKLTNYLDQFSISWTLTVTLYPTNVHFSSYLSVATVLLFTFSSRSSVVTFCFFIFRIV